MEDFVPISAFDGLSARNFFNVKSLREIAAINVIGIASVNLGRGSNAVYNALLQLGLPVTVNSLLKQLVRPINKATLDWCSGQFKITENDIDKILPAQIVAKHGLHWMWCGVVDVEKMATLVVRDESLSVVKRVAIACENSLPVDIHLLWARLTDQEKYEYLPKGKVAQYWKAVLTGDVANLVRGTSFSSEKFYAFEAAVEVGNLPSIKYFLNQISPDERSGKIFESMQLAFRADASATWFYQPCIVPYFILQLSPAQHLELIFTESITLSYLLRRLLMWPWQDLFIPTVNAAFSLLGNEDSRLKDMLFILLQSTLPVISEGLFIDPLLVDISMYIWQKLSQSQIERFFSTYMFAGNFGPLFLSESRQFLDVVFNGVDIEMKKKLAFADSCVNFVSNGIKMNNWKLVELVVEYMLPKDILILRRFELKVGACFLKMMSENRMGGVTDQDLKKVRISSFGARLEKISQEHFMKG